MTQVTIPNKGSTSPGRSRRGKPRYRKAGKGSSGDLAQLKATLSSSLAMVNSTTSVPSSKQHLDPSAALRGLQHDLLLKKMYSSSPDLISTTLEAEGRRKGQARPGLDRAGSQSASAGLGESRTGGPDEGPDVGAGTDDLADTPPRSDTPSEDAGSIPFSSSPDSPCGRGAAAGRASVLGNPRVSHEGEEKEDGAVITRSPRSQRLTPAALLYRAAVTRSQVRLYQQCQTSGKSNHSDTICCQLSNILDIFSICREFMRKIQHFFAGIRSPDQTFWCLICCI